MFLKEIADKAYGSPLMYFDTRLKEETDMLLGLESELL